MDPDDFMEAIARAYHKARDIEPIDRKVSSRLVRGRSRSISSEAEELLATYLLRNCGCIGQIRIDQPTRLEKNESYPKTRVFYPDLMILRDNIVEHLIDVKTDIGWARDKLPETAERHSGDVIRARGRTCAVRDSEDKSNPITFAVSENLTYDIVLVSAANVNEKQLADGLREARAVNLCVDIFVLSSGLHPNSYDYSPQEVVQRMNVHRDEFERLKARVCKPKRGIISSLFSQRH